MFMGHYGPAVWDSRRGKTVPLISLWQAFLAVQAVDIIFAVLAILGIEGTVMKNGLPFFDIPWSHSLLSAIVISLAAGAVFRHFKPQSGMKGFWIIAALAFSHWLLDLVVHRPDLSIYPGGSQLFGFGFWNYVVPSFILEIGLLFIGLFYWVRVTRAKNSFYNIAPWGLYAFMVALQFAFITLPGLQLQRGIFDPSAQPQGAFLGVSALFVFGLLALLIGLIERGRPSNYALSSST